jgi:hypothetical protein
MKTHAQRAAGGSAATIALAFAMALPLGATASAAEGGADAKADAHTEASTADDEIELPSEVRALLDEPAASAAPSERTETAPPDNAWSPTPTPGVELGPTSRAFYGSSLETSAPSDPFVGTSVGALIAAGVLAAIGVGLSVDGDAGRVCGGLAGCVEMRAPSDPAREGAAFSLIGASVGASVTGGLSLLISLARPPEPGGTRDSAAQGAIGLGFVAGGSALLGAGIAGGIAGDSRVSGDAVAALVTAGLASGGLGAILLLTRSPNDEPAAHGPSAASPRVSVGLGSAEATWSF